MRKAAVALHDHLMHTKLAGIDLIAKKVHVKYHHSCKSSYIQRVQDFEKQSSAVKDEKSRLHSEAYEKLKVYDVTNTLIENDAELLTSLHSKYITLLGKSDSKYPARSLHEKLNKTFTNSLKTTKRDKNAGLIVYNGSLSEEAAIRKNTFDEHSVKEMPPITDVDELPDPHSRCFGQRTIRHSEIYSGIAMHQQKKSRGRHNPQ